MWRGWWPQGPLGAAYEAGDGLQPELGGLVLQLIIQRREAALVGEQLAKATRVYQHPQPRWPGRRGWSPEVAHSRPRHGCPWVRGSITRPLS
jgi:hypothetical protein